VLSVQRSTEIVRKSSSFFHFRKHIREKFLINFYNNRIPKANPRISGPLPGSNSGLKS